MRAWANAFWRNRRGHWQTVTTSYDSFSILQNGEPTDDPPPFHPLHDCWVSAQPRTLQHGLDAADDGLGRQPHEADRDSTVPDQEGNFCCPPPTLPLPQDP